jgi:hypothetical protein
LIDCEIEKLAFSGTLCGESMLAIGTTIGEILFYNLEIPN